MLEKEDTIGFDEAQENYELEHWGSEESPFVLIDDEEQVEYRVSINDLVVNHVVEFDQ